MTAALLAAQLGEYTWQRGSADACVSLLAPEFAKISADMYGILLSGVLSIGEGILELAGEPH